MAKSNGISRNGMKRAKRNGVVYFWKATGGTNVLDALAETAIGCAVLADPTPVAAIKRTVKRIGAK